MMPIRLVHAVLLRADVADPRPESPYRLARNQNRPWRWDLVPDTGADDVDDPSIGGW